MPRSGSDSIKLLHKNDLFLILAFLLLAALAFAFVKMQARPGRMVRVTVDGQVYGLYSLNESQEIVIRPLKDSQTNISDNSRTNVLVISDGFADMTRADCPDKICVHHKPISKAGETIVCLPHKVVVEVTDEEGEKEIDGVAE